ncbi:MAG: CRISPR-associated protein Cas4, partial [Candidatus Nanohaloarchaeota archaeon]|nr:CRISPR-associated protein Cas4 [Candidatus Nanohaloarchaeota archaeon]
HKILSEKHENLGIEMKVNLQLDKNINLIGKIDRLVKIKDKTLLIDYKTSKPPKNTDAFSLIKGTEQLSLYAYILEKHHGIKIDKAILWYLENNKVVEAETEDISKIIYKIKDVFEKITEGIFTPNPSATCKNCSYKLICKYWQGVGKKEE